MSENIPWYSEASLRANDHVFCAGSVAQCVRKWTRLPEPERNSTFLRLSLAIDGRMQLGTDDLEALSRHSGLHSV